MAFIFLFFLNLVPKNILKHIIYAILKAKRHLAKIRQEKNKIKIVITKHHTKIECNWMGQLETSVDYWPRSTSSSAHYICGPAHDILDEIIKIWMQESHPVN